VRVSNLQWLLTRTWEGQEGRVNTIYARTENMSIYSFEIRNSDDLLNKLKDDFNEFKNHQLSSRIAINCAMSAWHLTDWVFEEYNHKLGFEGKGSFRASLTCDSLTLMHDIANGSKHLKVSNPKSGISESRLHEGDFALEDFCRDDFNVSRLELFMNNGDTVDFFYEIEKTVDFWQEYLKELKSR
jgi:hypothetical protein